MDADSSTDVRLTDTQLGILAALCRPISTGNHFATPATNQQIAAEVFLSVDAVKGHLRTLYRKFGIEDLPHNQKRARLVELAIEGGYLRGTDAAAPEAEPAPSAAPGVERSTAPVPPPGGGASSTPGAPAARVRIFNRMPGRTANAVLVALGAVLVLAVAAAILAAAGVFPSGASTAAAPTPAAFRAKVGGYCRLALAGAPAPAGRSRAARARADLEVIETMRGRLESLTPPAGHSLALERFGAGLTNAANYTSAVAESPPGSGSRAEARDVAELTFAAGQVQAGAVGYRLGHECLAIGDLVARSAQNAAAP